jgi:hypothetical protein
MSPLRTTAVSFVAALALGGLAATTAPANADETASEPCAQQQAQVDRANAKLASLTEKWQSHPSQANTKAKKAQAQRVARAQARLDQCQAEQDSTTTAA